MCRGVVDLLYFLRLESLCERAKNLAPEEAGEARRFLNGVVKAAGGRASERQLNEFKSSASERIVRLVRALAY